MNFDKIGKNLNEAIQPLKGKITMFDVVKNDYQKFLLKMEKSDFKNSSTRYMSELTLLERMKKQAQVNGFENEISSIDEKILLVKDILKKNFGIVFGDKQ